MKAKLTIANTVVDLEGSASEIAEVVSCLSEGKPAPLALKTNSATEHGGKSGQAGDKSVKDEQPSRNARLPEAKSFFTEKKPSNDREATATAAFYLRELAPDSQRSNTIGKDQLTAVFREANWKLPSRVDQTLVNTELGGYLKRVDRGKYELTNVGHNLVVHTLGNASGN